MTEPSKKSYLSASTEDVFGIRWIKTPRSKKITGVVMLGLGLVVLLNPDLGGSGLLIVILIWGGTWYLYKGFKK